jgi:hypothetical protein
MMHGPINVKSPNNNSKWQMGFNSAFKGLKDNYGRNMIFIGVAPEKLVLYTPSCKNGKN